MDDDDLDSIDLTALWLRRLTWDSLPCAIAEETHRNLGLVPPTPDQVENDHARSHYRMKTIEPLCSAVDLLAPLLSRVLSNAMYHQLPEASRNAMPPNVEAKFAEQNAELIRTAALVILAQFVSTGVLVYTAPPAGGLDVGLGF